MSSPKSVECVWKDACRVSRWLDADETLTLVVVQTRGFLIEALDDRIVVAGSFCEEDGTYGEAIAIPRGCIVHVRELSPELGEDLLHFMS